EANEPRPRVEPANAVDVERERWVAQAQTAAVAAMNGVVPPRIPQHPDDALEPYVPRAIALPVTLPALHQSVAREVVRLVPVMAQDEGARAAVEVLNETLKITSGLLLAVAAYGVQIDDVRPEPNDAQGRGDADSIATEGEAVE